MYDADVVLPNNRRIAMEITTVTDGQFMETWRLADRLDWVLDGLVGRWYVSIRPSCNLHELRRQLPGVLNDARAIGQTKIIVQHHPADLAQIHSQLSQLSVRLAVHLEGGEDGEVLLAPAGEAGATSPDLIADAVTIEANKPDNVLKLFRAEAHERHLFIWLMSSQHQLMAAITLDMLPSAQPDLPECVDVIWVAPAYDPPAAVLRYSRDDGWSRQLLSPG